MGDPQVIDNGSVIGCTYPPASGTKSVILRFQTGSSAGSFTAGRDGYAANAMKTSDFPGFAEQAYTNVLSAGSITTNTLVARKG